MRKDKVRAYELRRKQKSYSEISRLLAVPKSTLSAWFKEETWSHEIRDRLSREQSLSSPKKLANVIKATKTRWAKNYQTYREAAKVDFERLHKDPRFLAAVMLYWGEGDKSQKRTRIKLTNSDPQMIRLFYAFLRDILRLSEERIYAWLLLYPDLSEDMQKNFWSRAAGIPLTSFKKSIFIKGKHPKRRLSYGVCNVCVSSRELKEKMLVWLDLYQKKLLSLAS